MGLCHISSHETKENQHVQIEHLRSQYSLNTGMNGVEYLFQTKQKTYIF